LTLAQAGAMAVSPMATVPTHDFSTQLDILSGDLTCADIVDVLENLRFSRPNRTAVVEIDSAVRDFIVDRIKAPQR
jgi:hypothetical protein